MKYEKPFLTFEEQAERLIQRGLESEKTVLINRLENVNYYRLSAYWYPFRKKDSSDPAGNVRTHEFVEGTTLDSVWRRYTFDRQLRILVMDAVERAEVAVRTKAIYLFCRQYGPFGYENSGYFLDKMNLNRFLEELDKAVMRSSHEAFVAHYEKKYTSEKRLPLWMLAEIMTFGAMFTFVKNFKKPLQKELARSFGIPGEVLISWLTTLNYVRNICAHHGRLWNRELAIKPYIPRAGKYPDWHTPVSVPQHRIFGVLTILRYFMTLTAPQSHWTCRLMALFKQYDELPKNVMGFPENWEECPVWHNCRATHRIKDI